MSSFLTDTNSDPQENVLGYFHGIKIIPASGTQHQYTVCTAEKKPTPLHSGVTLHMMMMVMLLLMVMMIEMVMEVILIIIALNLT